MVENLLEWGWHTCVVGSKVPQRVVNKLIDGGADSYLLLLWFDANVFGNLIPQEEGLSL
jgi:hypothetical protein